MNAIDQTVRDADGDASLAREEVARTLGNLGIAETELGHVSATIGRNDEAVSSERPLGAEGRASLPSISLDLGRESPTDLEVDLVARDELGRGGMGVVWRAQQRSLERDVAVKTAKEGDRRAARALVREGKLMGGLEHPSVVPVHALGVGPSGTPVLVMKRVEGVTWRVLLRDEHHEGWKPLLVGHQDRLRAHVEILAQVCRAIAFAHDRGVVHRDVKPDNVMIGRFGEVYLLDWGVALRIRDRDAEPASLVGTPAYIAPEMIAGDPRQIDERSDVYLLGGTLYEILTGKMPHEAPTALAALVASMIGAPLEMPQEAPRELVALVHLAMAREREKRVPSAEAFREGLARFLASYEADRVAADGRAAVRRAEELAATRGDDAPEVFRALVEARFAFVAALRIRPDDRSARAALETCLGHLVEREIALRSAAGARAALSEMQAPPAALETKVAALEKVTRAERDAEAELEKQRREQDASIAFRSMIKTAIVFLVLGGAVLLTQIFTAWGEAHDPATVASRWALVLGVSCVAAWFSRDALLATTMARRLTGLFATVFFVGAISAVVSARLRDLPWEAGAHSFLACAGVTAAGAFALLPELWLSVVVLVGAGVASFWCTTEGAMQVLQGVAVAADIAAVGWALFRHSQRTRAERLAAGRPSMQP